MIHMIVPLEGHAQEYGETKGQQVVEDAEDVLALAKHAKTRGHTSVDHDWHATDYKVATKNYSQWKDDFLMVAVSVKG